MTDPPRGRAADQRHLVAEYFRLERWEIPPLPGSDGPFAIGGRAPVDDHQRGPGGGLRTGALLTSVDSLGGFLCGLSVQPEWIVTTSIMATVPGLSHQGPLRLHGRVLRRGRNSVVAAVDVVDEGDGERAVAAATVTCAVLDPGDMELPVERPFAFPMPPPDPDAVVPEEFFGIEPGVGSVTRLEVSDRLRNPWGILHGGALAVLADTAACRAVGADRAGRVRPGHDRPDRADGGHGDAGAWAAADTVLHFLRPVKAGPVEARCQVLGGQDGRTLVRVAIHDLGAGERMATVGSVVVLDV
jgi:acyl-coenzyme A thioesterase PaaI-like protein